MELIGVLRKNIGNVRLLPKENSMGIIWTYYAWCEPNTVLLQNMKLKFISLVIRFAVRLIRGEGVRRWLHKGQKVFLCSVAIIFHNESTMSVILDGRIAVYALIIAQICLEKRSKISCIIQYSPTARYQSLPRWTVGLWEGPDKVALVQGIVELFPWFRSLC